MKKKERGFVIGNGKEQHIKLKIGKPAWVIFWFDYPEDSDVMRRLAKTKEIE